MDTQSSPETDDGINGSGTADKNTGYAEASRAVGRVGDNGNRVGYIIYVVRNKFPI